MNVRAKFMLTEHHIRACGGGQSYHEFVFTPQYNPETPEDQRFSKASPTGEMKIVVDNPPVVEYWAARMGKQFYLDFTEADADGA
jgi:hypothetical protein